ncbi:PAS domain S-box-containing protein [Desulfobaculum xiamenense]|uniref:histidine kinase n=1 Tax=Desulfobaculum xiamenense TaxID=995050 RepID=A0A846QXN6_9BACT|nr:PAS domain S-box protein [Desulfobaculum xiamenense]NJB69389.1 PAS domain S-box-containing protein [Desulfobaculum xiamenense]
MDYFPWPVFIRRHGGWSGFIAFCAACVIVSTILPCAASSDLQGRRAVLFLHSYHPSLWTENIMRGYREVLDDFGDLDVFVEYMDTKRDHSPAYLHALRDAYYRKYRRTRFAVVLVSDNTALRFAVEHGRTLFPDAAIVFCGVNGYSPEMLGTAGNVTGVVERVEYSETLHLARRLLPDVAWVYVIADRTPTGEINLEAFMDVVAQEHSDLPVLLLRDVTVGDLRARIPELPRDSFVFFLSFWKDMVGDDVSQEQISAILRTSPVPVFDRTELLIGRGVLGGKCACGYEQGRAAARLAARILGGESPANIPVVGDVAGVFTFDYAQLHRYGLAEADLPAGSRIIGRPPDEVRIKRAAAFMFGGTLGLAVVMTFVLSTSVIILRRSRAAVMYERDRSADLIARTPAVICGVAPDGTTNFINPFGEQVTGWTTEQLVGRNWWDTFYPGDERAQIDRLFERMEGGDVGGYEMVLTTADGMRRTVVWTSMNRYGPRGDLVEIVGFGDDVTERRAARKALSESEARYRLLFESAHDAILIVRGGRIVDCNSSAQRLFGLDFEELVGRTPASLSVRRQPGGELSSVRAGELFDMAERGEACVFDWEHVRADGTSFEAEVSLAGYAVGDGKYVQAIVRDVTEARRMRDMMVQNEKMQALGGLAAGMAHELNNPLGAILQSAQNVERRLSDAVKGNLIAAERVGVGLPQVRAYLYERGIFRMLDGIRDAGNRAAGIVRGMLELGDVGAIRLEPCDLAECVSRSLELVATDESLARQVDFSMVRVERENGAGVECVPCVRADIEQVVLNLLRNAAQAVASVPEPVIGVCTRKEGNFAVIEVEDNGPGVPESERRRVFEPFYTTRSPGDGTGLGLSVSYFIVTRKHGGELRVEDAGPGARFVVRLPLVGGVCLE